MQESATDLRRCSKCKSTILLKYFETNRKGELYRTCNNCRKTNKIYQETHKEETKTKYRQRQLERAEIEELNKIIKDYYEYKANKNQTP